MAWDGRLGMVPWAKVSAALLHSIKLPVAGAPDTRPFPRNWKSMGIAMCLAR
jgi:hypothetical protein